MTHSKGMARVEQPKLTKYAPPWFISRLAALPDLESPIISKSLKARIPPMGQTLFITVQGIESIIKFSFLRGMVLAGRICPGIVLESLLSVSALAHTFSLLRSSAI